jgi:hypothetical protein
MKKMWHPLAASLLLLAGQASAGNDFCDNPQEVGLDPSNPNGGGCEVNLMLETDTLGMGGTTVRLHDLIFDAPLYERLRARPDDVRLWFYVLQFNLGSSLSTSTESNLVEWSFRPDNKSNAERILSLSYRREADQLELNADWLAAPDGWSAAANSGVEPVLIDHQKVKLGPIDDAPPQVYMRRHGATVEVWVDGSADTPMRFNLPEGRWTPIRLRNGLLRGTLQFGMGTELMWPPAFHDPPPTHTHGPGQPPIGLDPLIPSVE